MPKYFNCIESSEPLVPHMGSPFLTREELPRAIGLEILRHRIKAEHRIDLTRLDTVAGRSAISRIRALYGSGTSITVDDPLGFENWLIKLNLPHHVGFAYVLDLVHTDFLIVESLSFVKDALGIGDLRNTADLTEGRLPTGASEVIDFTIETGVFHLMSAIYRLRANFDKLVAVLGHALHAGKQIDGVKKYDARITKLRDSEYARALVQIDQTHIFEQLISYISDVADLKKLRDREAHIGNLGVKYGLAGKSAIHDIGELITITLENLARFRTSFLLLLAFLHSIREGGSFPAKCQIIVTASAVIFFDEDARRKYMTFVVGKNNAIEKAVKELDSRDGIFTFKLSDDSVVTVNFPEDTIKKNLNGKVYMYDGTILGRNAHCGYTNCL